MCTCRAVGHHSSEAKLLGCWGSGWTIGKTGKSLEAVLLSLGCPLVVLVLQQFCWCRWCSLGHLIPWEWLG